MSLLITALIVVLLAGLVIWIIDRSPVLDQRLKWLLDAIVILIAVLVIASRAGLVSG